MCTRDSILHWQRTTKVEYPNLAVRSASGQTLTLFAFLNGVFVVRLGDEDIYRGDNLDDALQKYETARGFPSGTPNQG